MMMEVLNQIKWTQTKKQAEAWKLLTNNTTSEILFGGGAGGAKSFLGCAWLILMCLQYSGTRWVIARNVLKRLKETTLITFFKVCKMWGLKVDIDYVYKQDSGIEFLNGSQIILKELFYYPTDPEFDSLGSLEITGAFVDEVSQVSEKAINVLSSRCGRWLNLEYALLPKILMSCNPTKKWLYSNFYKPWKENKLLPYRAFIQALVKDNPFIAPYYIQNLQRLDKNTKERLLFGNWEFDDDPAKIFEYEDIIDLFTNKAEFSTDKYISCDVARFGDDKTVIMLWHGLQVKKIIVFNQSSTTIIIETLQKLCEKEQIKRHNVIVDEDGIGGGVVDGFSGCKGFINNSKAIIPRFKSESNFSNLKTQAYYELARLTSEGKIGIDEISIEEREALIQELEQIKQKDIDKDGKISLIGKDTIKENLGRSPDFADALMMRMYFELKGKPILTPILI